jgi:peroxiredoxin
MNAMLRTSSRIAAAAIGALVLLPAASAPRPEDPPAPVVRSDTADLLKPAPDFELKGIDGKTVKLSSLKGKLVVLEWFNPACPYCVYAYGEKGPLKFFPEQLRGKGIVWLSIVSERPDNSGGKVENIQKFVDANGIKAPMLLDPDGKVGKLYGAKTTPALFVINEKGVLVYKGALDNAPFGQSENNEAHINYVEAALTDLGAGRAVTKAETKSYG